MRITDVVTTRLRFDPPGDPMADAIHFMPTRTFLLVQVHTDDGTLGKSKVGSQPQALMNPLQNMDGNDYATVTFEEGVERVRAARDAVGSSVYLSIDANNAWTPSLALQFMHAVEDLNIYWLEEPVNT